MILRVEKSATVEGGPKVSSEEGRHLLRKRHQNVYNLAHVTLYANMYESEHG